MKKFVTLITIVSLMLTAMTGCGKTVSGSVSTDGSTSMEKVIGALGEAFEGNNSGVTFTYNPTGSGSGITAVAEGRCDIGLSSRNLKDEEKAQGLTETILALDGIAIIVNPDNPVNDLDLETIGRIYRGEITNWKDIGGNDLEIVLIGREAGSGTRDGFEEDVTFTDSRALFDALWQEWFDTTLYLTAKKMQLDNIIYEEVFNCLSKEKQSSIIAKKADFARKAGITL